MPKYSRGGGGEPSHGSKGFSGLGGVGDDAPDAAGDDAGVNVVGVDRADAEARAGVAVWPDVPEPQPPAAASAATKRASPMAK